MSLGGLARSLRDAWEVPRDLALKRYPPFVTGGALPPGDVPVFVFHSLEPVSFERKLQHLRRNGYATLGADEHFQVLMGARRVPDRAVVLTFDDGRGTLWGVGRPLLEKYGMKGVVFLVPGRTRTGAPGPTLRDVAAGKAEPETVTGRDETPDGLLTWEEIDELSRAGVYEFQSHTQHHARVHTAPRVAGFVTPERRHGYAAFDVPLLRAGGTDRLAHEVPLGTPFLVSEPRTSNAWRFVEDEDAGGRCVDRVAGDPSFFRRRDWEKELAALVGPVKGRLETTDERVAHIAAELGTARRDIEERTGRPVTHLCYPWHASGRTSQRLATESGYRTAYQGKVRGVPITRAGGDPLNIARLGEDWVELLPGAGRLTLSAVMRRKWSRRFAPARV